MLYECAEMCVCDVVLEMMLEDAVLRVEMRTR
jgi:hypothetical protein